MAKGGLTGLSGLRVALLDEDGKVLAPTKGGLGTDGIYKIDKIDDLGVNAYSITNTAGSLSPVFGSDSKVDVQVGTPQPTANIVVNALNFDTKAKLSGWVDDGKGGYAPNGNKPVHAAFIGETHLLDGSVVYIGIGNAIVTTGDIALGTNQDSETRVTDTFTANLLATDAMSDGYKIYNASNSAFKEADMLAEVFVSASTEPSQG